MTTRGLLSAAGVEWSKAWVQARTRAVLAVCAIAPFVFVASLRVQSSVPSDTLFGRAVNESGFATPLLVLGFAALWVLPALTSVFGGDIFSAEDRYGTWTTVLTRSGRADIFAAKVIVAIGFSILAVVMLAACSLIAGVLLVGRQPLIDLSGAMLSPPSATAHIVFAWASVLPPCIAFTSLALMVSVATRSSTAGVGLPVVAGLAMQLYSFVDGPEVTRRLLLTSSFGVWHGLLADPPYYRPLVDGTIVSAAYTIVCATIAYEIFRARDIGR